MTRMLARSPAVAQSRDWISRRYAWAKLALAGAPGTMVYLFALAVTSWTLRGADPRLEKHLIISQSTNLDNMTHQPVDVLIGSAFWVTGSHWQLLIEFLLVMVPVERWLGTRRWLATFAIGHVGATLVTVTGIAYGIHHGLLDVSVDHVSDVGVSYGFFAVAAVLAYRITDRRLRWGWAAFLILYLGLSALQSPDFTAYGHLTALSLGFACYPLTRRPNAVLQQRQEADAAIDSGERLESAPVIRLFAAS
jgi:hypothetical protein